MIDLTGDRTVQWDKNLFDARFFTQDRGVTSAALNQQ
jgi:hypothetical protein